MMANWCRTHLKQCRVWALSLGLIFAGNTASAFSPQPFALELEGFFYRGVPVQVLGTQTLEQLAEGHWRMTLSARGLFVRLTEQSEFIWHGDRLIPLHYRYELNAPFEQDVRTIEFDPRANEIRTQRNDDHYTHPYHSTWLDPLSYTLLLKRDLLAGQSYSEFTLLDRNHPRTYRFEQITHPYAPEHSIVYSQVEPNHGDIFIVFSEQSFLPAHLLRWNDGRINYQIKTLSGVYDGQHWSDFPHWPNPRRNNP
jgi:hypothetical protein